VSAAVSDLRLNQGLRAALGSDIARLLDAPDTTDVMLNAPLAGESEGRIWMDRLGSGRTDTGITMTPAAADYALRMLASHAGTVLTRTSPILSATMPGSGERVAGAVSPVTSAPVFAIRVPPRQVFDLDAFAPKVGETVSQETAVRRIEEAGSALGTLRRAVDDRKSIIVAGATGSGKTSLLSALMAMESVRRDRVLAIEDTMELALDGIPDHVRLLTSLPDVDMRALVQFSLRMRPDRIIIGEFRGGPAMMAFLHAANTGHAGSMGSLHANSCEDAIGRIEDLASEVCAQTPTRAIRTAIGCIVFMANHAIREVVLT